MKNARHTPKDEAGAAGKPRKFTGTCNLRHLRVLVALLLRPRSREELDRIAGCSNGPDLRPRSGEQVLTVLSLNSQPG